MTGRRKLCFALMSCVLLLLMAEAGLRFSGLFPMPDGLFLQDATDDRHLTDPVLFWRLNPGLTRKADDGGSWYTWRVNEQGFRADSATLRAKPPGVKRVLCLGDSIPFGWGVDRERAYPARLAEKLRAAGTAVEVINAGVPGYSSYQVRLYLEQRLLDYAPDVVVVQVGVNDGNPVRVEDRLRQPGSVKAHPLERVALFRMFGQLVSGSPAFRCYMIDYLANLDAIASLCRSRGIRLILLLPVEVDRGQLTYAWPPVRHPETAPELVARYWKLVGSQLQVDLMAAFRAAGPGEPERLFLDEGRFACHLTAAGHEVVAGALFRALVEAGFGRR